MRVRVGKALGSLVRAYALFRAGTEWRRELDGSGDGFPERFAWRPRSGDQFRRLAVAMCLTATKGLGHIYTALDGLFGDHGSSMGSSPARPKSGTLDEPHHQDVRSGRNRQAVADGVEQHVLGVCLIISLPIGPDQSRKAAS